VVGRARGRSERSERSERNERPERPTRQNARQTQNNGRSGLLNVAGGTGNGLLQNVMNILRVRQKRDIEQTDNVTSEVSRTPSRTYGIVAQDLINQVRKKFKVSHPRVQELIESICDTNPITKLAPAVDRIWMVALGECEILGTERHVNAKWIKLMRMENHTEAFKPICPPRSCCKSADMVSPSMLCSGGGVARPICNTNTCQWSYDCGNKTVLEKEIVAEIVLNVAARATDDTVATFANDEVKLFGMSTSSAPLVLGSIVIVLPFIALAIILVVLYKMRRNALDY